MAIQKFELDAATDLDKQKLPIKTVNGVSPNSSGDVVVNDYVTKLSVSGKTITYTKKDGASGTITTQDTVYTHPSTHPASMITGLASVATSGEYSDLSGKPSIPATPKAYVTATWNSGSSWYRVWSDGWKEQGGYVDVAIYSTVTVTLHLSMSNTNYTILEGSQGGSESTMRINTGQTTTSFNLSRHYTGSAKGNGSAYWYVCGY